MQYIITCKNSSVVPRKSWVAEIPRLSWAMKYMARNHFVRQTWLSLRLRKSAGDNGYIDTPVRQQTAMLVPALWTDKSLWPAFCCQIASAVFFCPETILVLSQREFLFLRHDVYSPFCVSCQNPTPSAVRYFGLLYGFLKGIIIILYYPGYNVKDSNKR